MYRDFDTHSLLIEAELDVIAILMVENWLIQTEGTACGKNMLVLSNVSRTKLLCRGRS